MRTLAEGLRKQEDISILPLPKQSKTYSNSAKLVLGSINHEVSQCDKFPDQASWSPARRRRCSTARSHRSWSGLSGKTWSKKESCEKLHADKSIQTQTGKTWKKQYMMQDRDCGKGMERQHFLLEKTRE